MTGGEGRRYCRPDFPSKGGATQYRLADAVAASLVVQAPATRRFWSHPTHWPSCRMRQEAVVFHRLEDMPESIQADFRRRIGRVAALNDAFNPGDVVYVGDPTPERRFLQGVRRGGYWFIWYEHGGIGLHRHVLTYAIGVDGIPPDQRPAVALVSNLTGDPCSATDAILDGVFEAEEF
jgi:hypothetical protein